MDAVMIADLEEEGYVFRRDGIVLGKDGFKMPSYLAKSPYHVDLECKKRWEGKQNFLIAHLIAAKYKPCPGDLKSGTYFIRHINSLQSDSSVENLEWVKFTSQNGGG
ncbi:hypothetical protein KASHIRA_01140 [Serratia phage vB_SmaM-Kashira]|nr:hypothetical protein [Acinetobacter phage ABPH49]URC22688.1 hypothetical protein KASHIRA_01140 [Serratia phage vB_SmaM-Kashira]